MKKKINIRTIVLQCLVVLLLDHHTTNASNFLANDAHSVVIHDFSTYVSWQKPHIEPPLQQLRFVDNAIRELIVNTANNAIHGLRNILSDVRKTFNIIHSVCFDRIIEFVKNATSTPGYEMFLSDNEQIFIVVLDNTYLVRKSQPLFNLYSTLLVQFELLENSEFLLPHIKSLQKIIINNIDIFLDYLELHNAVLDYRPREDNSCDMQINDCKRYEEQVIKAKSQSYDERIAANVNNTLLNGISAGCCFKINSTNDESINIGEAQLKFVNDRLNRMLTEYIVWTDAYNAKRLPSLPTKIHSRLMMLVVLLSGLSGSAIMADESIANKGIIHATCFCHIINSINPIFLRNACLDKPIDISDFSIASYFDRKNVDLYELLNKYEQLYIDFEDSGSNNPKLLEKIRLLQEIISVNMNFFFMENEELVIGYDSIADSFAEEQRKLQYQ